MNKYIYFLSSLLFSTLFCHTPFLEKNIYTLPKVHKIPKIIHHIWVGKKEIPKEYLEHIQTWKTFHPDWELKLWTDEDVDNFPWQNKALFLKSTNPGMKSDIWRYEILKVYGGLYVDTDMECRRCFDPIHERLEFYAGLDNETNFIVANCVIGAAPNSPILKSIVNSLTQSTRIIDVENISLDNIQAITGPGLLTAFAKQIPPFSETNLNLIFTKEYFQPVACKHHGRAVTKKEIHDVRYSCFAIHHNGCSWFK